jgi:hypothetical protein
VAEDIVEDFGWEDDHIHIHALEIAEEVRFREYLWALLTWWGN